MQQRIRHWKIENKRNILQRLLWIRSQEDGVVMHYDDGIEEILVIKKGHLVFLHFVGECNGEGAQTDEKVISNAMSFIDISNPLMLYSPYSQAMLMCLAFIKEPKNLYMLGFGGGRIPLVLHHHLPQLVIESSEQSKGVVSLLEVCFGIKTNEQSGRINLEVIDGKKHLNTFSEELFDIIMLDTFSGAGMHPNELSSPAFYQLCKLRLTNQGVIATNLVSSSPDFHQKVEDFCQSFKYCYSFSHQRNHVYLGSDFHQLNKDEIVQQAILVDKKYAFDFKLVEQAKLAQVL